MKKELLMLAMAGLIIIGGIAVNGSRSTNTAVPAETTVAELASAEGTTIEEIITEKTSAEETPAEETGPEETTLEGESAETETTVLEETAPPETEDFVTAFDSFLEWTGKEWNAAPEDEKKRAAVAYSIYLTEATGNRKYNDKMRTVLAREDIDAEHIQKLVEQLDQVFMYYDSTLKAFSETSIEKMKQTAPAESQ